MLKKIKIVGLSIFMAMFFSALVFAQSANDLVVGLVNQVETLNLNDHVENCLLIKLESAQKSLNSGHYKAAVGKIHAFKVEVKVIAMISEKTGKNFLTANQANVLLSMADLLISVIKETTVSKVGVSGGTVIVNDKSSEIYGASVTIPEGALNSEILITITPDSSPPPLPSTFSASGPAVTFGPEGLSFTSPVMIAIPYYEKPGIDEKNLKIFAIGDTSETWEEIPVVGRDIENNILYATVMHFSSFQVGYQQNSDPDAPTINFIRVWSQTSQAGGKGIVLICSVTDPNGTDPFPPNNIRELKVEGPNGFSYRFIKGDYYYWVPTKATFYLKWMPLQNLPESGEYKFTVTDEEDKSSSLSKNLVVNPIPHVDSSSIQISSDGINWRSPTDSRFEGVPLDKPLYIRWNPVSNASYVYYRIHIQNSNGTGVYVSERKIDNQITIPVAELNKALIENAVYRIRIEAYDDTEAFSASNRSLSNLTTFTTGDLSFATPYFRWACVHTDSPYYKYLMYVDLDGSIGKDNFDYMKMKKPNGEEKDLLKDGTFFTFKVEDLLINEFYIAIPNTSEEILEKGEYEFMAKYKSGPEIRIKDYFNIPRFMNLPTSIFGSTDFNNPLIINTLKPTFLWNFLDEAKSYQVAIDEYFENPPYWGSRFYSNWVTGNHYTIPFNLENGKTYRWNIRARDGDSIGTFDNRSQSEWRYFKVVLE